MGGIQKSLLVTVAAILGFCAVAGFAMGLTSTFSRKVATGDDDETPIAANLPPGVVIKDAQALAPPPPPVPVAPKPKADALAVAASDTPPSSAPAAVKAAPVAAPPESAPGAPASLAPAPIRPPAPLPTDLPPT